MLFSISLISFCEDLKIYFPRDKSPEVWPKLPESTFFTWIDCFWVIPFAKSELENYWLFKFEEKEKVLLIDFSTGYADMLAVF